MTDSEKEIYDQTYSIELKKRKFKYIVGSTIVTGAVASVMLMGAMSGFSLSGGGCVEFDGTGIKKDCP